MQNQNFFTLLWNWLNGNKTIFGSLILTIAANTPSTVLVPFLNAPLDPILVWVGSSLAGVGVIHKLVKATTSPEPNQ